jgi:hypothetical protein
MPFPALLSTLLRSRFQVKPATLLITVDLFFLLLVEEFYGTRYQKLLHHLNKQRLMGIRRVAGLTWNRLLGRL